MNSNNRQDDKKIQPNNEGDQSIGSTLTFKIKDSLYMGTSIEVFKDQQFILLNWIENVIVLQTQGHKFDDSLKQFYGQEHDFSINVDNQIQSEYIRYLHCDSQLFKNHVRSQDKNIQQVLQKQDQSRKYAINFQQIFNFIQQAQQKGTSCLILSASSFPTLQTTGYIFTICTAYMMKKYNWSIYKSLEYMNAKHPNASISQQSLQFLNELQISIMKNQILTYNWQEWRDEEDLIIRNTFINGRESKWNENHSQKGRNDEIFKVNKNQTKTCSLNEINRLQTSPINQSQYKSILKEFRIKGKQKLVYYRKKTKVIINQQLNKVKQFVPNQQQIQQNNPILTINNDKSQQIQTQKRQRFKTARNQRISLSVRKLVDRYRNQINSDSKNVSMLNSKKISFDNCFQMNTKSLNKKKSFYNFQACHKFQQIKSIKNLQNDGISRIVNKLKTQNDIQKTQQVQIRKLQTLPQQNLETQKSVISKNQRNKQKIRNKTDYQRFSPIKQTQNNKSWLEIINKKRHSNETSLIKMFKKQSLSKRKNNKENEQRQKNHKKSNEAKVYIKEIKKNMTESLTQRKNSINQKVFTQQSGRKKDKHLIIQLNDFKQMIRSKQKSIGNLALQYIDCSTKKQGLLQKDEKIVSVIQKLKKQSFSNSSSKVNSKININSVKMQKRNLNSKLSQTKWR